MQTTINFRAADVSPSVTAVLLMQGLPESVKPDERLVRLAQESLSVFEDMAKPSAILADISGEAFEVTFEGEGLNDVEAPLAEVYRKSDNLALFAVTVGQSICDKISRLFSDDEFPLGSMLDAAASEGAELAANAVEQYYRQTLVEFNGVDSRIGLMRFSPGYCGWHVSSQKKLFESLRPETIGIRLNESFLMQPLKSISGVIVAGRKEIFEFDDAMSFCGECVTHSCRDRVKAMSEE